MVFLCSEIESLLYPGHWIIIRGKLCHGKAHEGPTNVLVMRGVRHPEGNGVASEISVIVSVHLVVDDGGRPWYGHQGHNRGVHNWLGQLLDLAWFEQE